MDAATNYSNTSDTTPEQVLQIVFDPSTSSNHSDLFDDSLFADVASPTKRSKLDSPFGKLDLLSSPTGDKWASRVDDLVEEDAEEGCQLVLVKLKTCSCSCR
jgi:hypothetical protein